jgi:hypothetical protein
LKAIAVEWCHLPATCVLTADQPESIKELQILIVFDWLRVSCVPDFTFRHSQGGALLYLDRER